MATQAYDYDYDYGQEDADEYDGGDDYYVDDAYYVAADDDDAYDVWSSRTPSMV